jgi:alginate O-acetyltransferase complex protein AlgI
MLFNSYLYIFIFLPITLAGFFLLARIAGEMAAILWLILASFVFYGWWNPIYAPLLAASIAFNYLCGKYLQKTGDRYLAGLILALGVCFNLFVLGYFKYTGFFAEIANTLIDAQFDVKKLVLPLAISFFTFQQIAYLVDCYKRDVVAGGFLRYCLFVTFFPQLIAGPIVHHKEMMPQFLESRIFHFSPFNLALGFGIFVVGLFKKVVIADSLASFVTPAFGLAATGQDPGFYMSWLATFAFSLQVYFDFSGYSDMAIGAALIIGIQLPVNFYSPYKAASITELWRRWHMTLTRFILDYIFTPVSIRFARLSMRLHTSHWLLLVLANILPLLISFLIVGLWHGAGWNFVLFGLFHGLLLSLHTLWQEFRRARKFKLQIPRSLGVAMTLLAWVWGLVLFRAGSLTGVSTMYESMLDFSSLSQDFNVPLNWAIGIPLIYFLVLVLPNTEQLFHQYRPRLADKTMEKSRTTQARLLWRENRSWAVFLGILFFISVVMMNREVEFIYFQF